MKTVDITTTQNVTIEYELASWRERFMAFLLDFLILGFSWVVLVLILIGSFGDRYGIYLMYIILMPIVTFYTLYSESFMNGQTLGKKALGIKVVKINGNEPNFSDFALRWSMRFLDLWLTMGALASLLISSSAKNQRLGCIISGTLVIKLNSTRTFNLSEIMQIKTLQNYTPQFPQVTQLPEENMLFIKQILERYRKFPNEAHRIALKQASNKLVEVLEVSEKIRDDEQFLRVLLNDYIVLTR